MNAPSLDPYVSIFDVTCLNPPSKDIGLIDNSTIAEKATLYKEMYYYYYYYS